VDLSKDCTKTCILNAATCGFANMVSAVTGSAVDVLDYPARYGLQGTYSVITLTPPYQEVNYTELLEAACNSPLVTENSILVVEYPKEMAQLPYVLGGDKYFGVRCRRYGRTVLAIYVYRPREHFDLRPDEFV
jgi:16S rRNA (guanine966-N2)-methyltransferase